MTFFVTGAGGYIGSVATYLFLSNGVRVIAVDDFSTGFRAPLNLLRERFDSQVTWYERDVRVGCDDIFQMHPDIDVVVHFAARCSVDESVADPLLYFNRNVAGTLALLRSMKTAGIRRIVFSSTCAVYGDAQYVPVDEHHPCVPCNPYGESKRMVEKILERCAARGELQYMVLRYFNVCGASDDGLIGDSKKPSLLLVQNAVRGALGIESFYLTCQAVDTPDGTPIRDYVNVVDLCDAHLKAAELLIGGYHDALLNLGTGAGFSVLEILSAVEQITGKTLQRKDTTPRKGEYAKMIASHTAATRLLGWKPQRSIRESVESLVRWYTSHPHGWEN
ncbi:UDP-glucose 4-epimerase GalE [Candidatus Uhrbacteria bacterium]|nr:UDP-glucose 4-epimerase GalE [Candidatus Uhrbacteria bacterium]